MSVEGFTYAAIGMLIGLLLLASAEKGGKSAARRWKRHRRHRRERQLLEPRL